MINMTQLDVFGSTLLAFALTASAIPLTKKVATAFDVVAAPNRELPDRRPIPLLAGAPIIIRILVSLGLFSAVLSGC
jgi:UDP-N-acetylmuramyl pentapeptide phosphotransferase/UDP-N-acetylglucosamine-1-phosphate transferase